MSDDPFAELIEGGSNNTGSIPSNVPSFTSPTYNQNQSSFGNNFSSGIGGGMNASSGFGSMNQ